MLAFDKPFDESWGEGTQDLRPLDLAETPSHTAVRCIDHSFHQTSEIDAAVEFLQSTAEYTSTATS